MGQTHVQRNAVPAKTMLRVSQSDAGFGQAQSVDVGVELRCRVPVDDAAQGGTRTSPARSANQRAQAFLSSTGAGHSQKPPPPAGPAGRHWGLPATTGQLAVPLCPQAQRAWHQQATSDQGCQRQQAHVGRRPSSLSRPSLEPGAGPPGPRHRRRPRPPEPRSWRHDSIGPAAGQQPPRPAARRRSGWPHRTSQACAHWQTDPAARPPPQRATAGARLVLETPRGQTARTGTAEPSRMQSRRLGPAAQLLLRRAMPTGVCTIERRRSAYRQPHQHGVALGRAR